MADRGTMAPVIREIRFAARRLARAPLFTIIAVLTLAVGIGANSAIFSVVNGILLEPLPYERPDELVRVGHTASGLGAMGRELPLSTAIYFVYRDENQSLADIGLADEGAVTVTGESAPERVTSLVVTDGTLSLLGVEPILGRRFTRSDDAPGAPSTAMLSYGYWQRRFGGNPGVLGLTLTIDGLPAEIIGVLPRGFRVLQHDPAVYLPARLDPGTAQVMAFGHQAIGRLRSGTDIARADADLNRLIPMAFERYPSPMGSERIRKAGLKADLSPLKASMVGDVSTMLWVLLGTVGLILLLACANVANLFMVRAEGREREVAVQTALGAGPRRIVAGFVTESLLLGGAAAILGVGLAAAGLALLTAIGPASLPRIESIAINGRVIAFTAAIAILASLLFGVLPAFRYGRPDLHSALKEGGKGAGTGRSKHRARNGLVVVQVALALVLLIGSGLMIRSVRSLRDVDPGFREPEQVLTFRLFVPEAEVPELGRVIATHRQILDRLEQVPGVVSAGASWSTPMMPLIMSAPIGVDGVPPDPGVIAPPRRHDVIVPGFPETLRSPVLAGRALTWNDIDTGARVVLVTENLAREQWGSATAAVGKQVRLAAGAPASWFDVVGVVADIRYDGVSPAAPAMVFWPLGADGFGGAAARSLSFVVRLERNPAAAVAEIERAVWSINASLPLASVGTLGALLEGSMARAAFAMVMLSIAAAVALILGLVGIYGVISYVVTQRTREIGVRIALGARPADVRRMVIGQAALVTGTGIGIGLVAAMALTRAMGGLLHGVRAVDPLTYAGMALVIAIVALAASYLPTRRAVGVDPATALRSD